MWLGWILHNEELCDLYRSVTVVGVVKYRKLGWAGYAARKYHLFRSPGFVGVVKCRRLRGVGVVQTLNKHTILARTPVLKRCGTPLFQASAVM
jgi:hypothetical protein